MAAEASATVAPARFAIRCWAAGESSGSSVATRYQLGFVLQAGRATVPSRASTPQGTWASAMNSALTLSTSAAKEAGNFALSRLRLPSPGFQVSARQRIDP